MRQFDVVPNPDSEAGEIAPYLVVLQHDHLEALPTVIVAPLVPTAVLPGTTRLQPRVSIDGKAFVLSLPDLTAVLRTLLHDKPVGSIASSRDEVVRGLDLLFTGF